jgi:hypothetical protein
MFMADQDALAGSSHAVLDIVLLEALEACEDRGVFFRLGFFGAEGVVGQRVKAYSFGLIGVEGFGENWRIRRLQGGACYGRHNA